MRKFKIKISALLLITIITLTLSFIGCGEDITDPNSITVWCNLYEKEVNNLQKLADKWSEKSGINVIVEEFEVEPDDIITYGSNGADIVWGVPTGSTELLAKANAIEKVPNKEGYISKDDYVNEDLVQAATIDNFQYGYPVNQYFVTMYYNKDLVGDLEPETMEEVIDSKKGFGVNAANYYYSYGFISAYGGYFMKNKDGEFDKNDLGFMSEGTIKGFKFIESLRDKGIVDEDSNDDTFASKFAAGELGYYIGEQERIKKFDDKENLNYGVCTIPTLEGNTVKPYKDINMACVISYKDKKEDSFDLLNYLIKNSADYFMEETPCAPLFKSSLESDTFKKSKKLQSLYNQSINTEIGCNLTSSDSIDLNVNRYLSMLVIGDYNAKECAKKLDEDVKNSMNMTTVDK